MKCRILRRSCSMMKKPYRTRNDTVGTVKKSKATIPHGGCARMRAIAFRRRHGAACAGGSVRRFARAAQSRAFAIRRGSLVAPQPVFSWAKRRISARSSDVIFGRPPRRRDFQRQYRRKLARCQPTTVLGLTITSASRQRDQVLSKIIQKSRSRGRNGAVAVSSSARRLAGGVR